MNRLTVRGSRRGWGKIRFLESASCDGVGTGEPVWTALMERPPSPLEMFIETGGCCFFGVEGASLNCQQVRCVINRALIPPF